MSAAGEEALRALEALHEEVDREAAALARKHGEAIACRRGCADCCIDGLSVFQVEAERIRRSFPEVLAGAAHPSGACAFLDGDGACRIYAARPYVCRTQGLPLLWYEEDADEEIREERSTCERNELRHGLGALGEEEVWLIGPVELRLARLQEAFSGAGGERVPLRSLFGREA